MQDPPAGAPAAYRFQCPSCARAWRLSADRIGSSGRVRVRCPGCKQTSNVRLGAVRGPVANKSAPPAPRVAVAAHTDSFFAAEGRGEEEAGIELPDPERHRPSRQEYRDLLQEFSVMVRLDRRSRRQRVAIAVVLSCLVVGATGFGVGLLFEGNQKSALVRDSKAILAMFVVPHQTRARVRAMVKERSELAQRLLLQLNTIEPKVAEPGRLLLPRKPNRPKTPKKNRWRATKGIQPDRPDRRRTTSGSGPVADPEVVRAALERNRDLSRAEPLVRPTTVTYNVTRARLQGACKSALEKLVACSHKYAAGKSFRAAFTVGLDGRIANVRATTSGRVPGSLGRCAAEVLRAKKFGRQSRITRFTCSVSPG